MFRSHSLGRWFGVEIRAHGSLALVFGAIAIVNLISGGLGAAASFLLGALIVLVSITLHELGHIAAASLFGIGTRGITLYPFGGLASLDRESRSAQEELVVALAGPAVNVVLAAFAALALFLAPTALQTLPLLILWINMSLAIFNLVPAYPMDGGRVLRGVLWNWKGRLEATRLAARAGQGFAILFGLVGLLLPQLTLVLVAWFVYMQASAEYQRATHSQGMSRPIVERLDPFTGHRQAPRDEGWGSAAQWSEPPTSRPQVRIVRTPFGDFRSWDE